MSTTDAIRAGLVTAFWSFVAAAGPGLLGWLSEVGEWADSEGQQPFPAFSTLGYLGVAAAVAVIAGALNMAYRMAQAKGVIGGTAPTYVRRAPLP